MNLVTSWYSRSTLALSWEVDICALNMALEKLAMLPGCGSTACAHMPAHAGTLSAAQSSSFGRRQKRGCVAKTGSRAGPT